MMPAGSNRMPFPFLAAAVISLLPAIASAQPWAEAYRAGDYERAAPLLHAIVADDEYTDGGDPAPIRQLAIMYAKGLGVARDPISACTLAQRAEGATLQWAPRQFKGDIAWYEATLKDAERFKAQYCSGLSPDELRAASPGCLALGMPETLLAVGGQWVRVGRRGIRLADAAGEDRGFVNFCPTLIADVRVRSVSPPPDAAPDVESRHFVELFSWAAGRDQKDGVLKYSLLWQAYEVLPTAVHYAADSQLFATSVLPHPSTPLDLDTRVSFEMIRSGHVRWRIPGAPPKRGWIKRPDERNGR